MTKKTKKIKKDYPFGGAINRGVTGIASALGASDQTANLIGSGVATATGLIPGMQDNLTQGFDLAGDLGDATGSQALQGVGNVGSQLAPYLGMFANGGNMAGVDSNTAAILSALQNGGSLAEVNNGGTHEENPNGGVPIGANATVEEGETLMGDFVFSDRVINPNTGNSFSADSKKINKKLGKRKNESFDKKALGRELAGLARSQEDLKTSFGTLAAKNTKALAHGGLHTEPEGDPVPVPAEGTEAARLPGTQPIEDPDALARLQGAVQGADFVEGSDSSAPGFRRAAFDLPAEGTAPEGSVPFSSGTFNMYKTYPSLDVSNIESVKKFVVAGKGDMPIGEFKYGDAGESIELSFQEYLDITEGKTGGNVLTTKEATTAPVTETGTGTDTVQGTIPTDTRTVEEQQAAFEASRRTPLTLAYGGSKNPYANGGDIAGLIAGNAGNLFNLVQGLQKPDQTSFDRVDPTLVNMDTAAGQLQNQAASARASSAEAIRGNASSSGQALSNLVASGVGINQNLGAQTATLREREANANAQIQNRASAQNAQIGMQETIANEQNLAAKRDALGAGIQGLGQSVPGFLGVQNQRNVQQQQMDMMQSGNFRFETDAQGNTIMVPK